MATNNRTQALTGYFAPFYRRTAIELNNISIIFLHLGKHKIAMETLADAIEMIKYSIHEICDEAERKNDADKSIRRAVEALLGEDEPLTRNIDGTSLPYSPRRLHDIDLDEMDIHCRVQEESTILLFNMALTHLNHWISTSAHGSLQKSLSFLKFVLHVFKVENQCTSLATLHLLSDTLSSMGGIYTHLGQHHFAELCFTRVSRIAIYLISGSSSSAAAA